MGIFREWLSSEIICDVLLGKLRGKEWLPVYEKPTVDEMAIMDFGGDRGHRGKDHTEVPSGYLNWMLGKLKTGDSNFTLVDKGQNLNPQQQIAVIQAELQRRGQTPAAPAQQPEPPASPQQPNQPQPEQPQVTWYLAKTTNDKLGLEPDTPVAIAKVRTGWTYREKNGKVNGVFSNEEAPNVVSSVQKDGNVVKGNSPEELLGEPDAPEIKDEPSDKPNRKRGRPEPEDVRIPDKFMTEYNRNIEEMFLQGTNQDGTPANMMMNALAGTGKTTMLKHLASFIQPGEKWLYLVFNKKNQVEASTEFPKGIDVATTHSYLGKVLKGAGKEVGGNTQLPDRDEKGSKIYRILDKLVPKGRFDSVYGRFRWGAVSRIGHIASLAKAYALNPSADNIQEQLKQLVDKYAIDMDLSTERYSQDRDYTEDMINHTLDLLKLSLPNSLPPEYSRQDHNLRDQDDTLWYAAVHADEIRWNTNPTYNVVLMDEVQDFNECQLIMARKLKEAGARVIGVGDPNQAMYLFRGADADAFNRLQEVITDGASNAMPLPINFRSLPTIIDYVRNNTHVTDLKEAPDEFWNAKGIDPNSGEITEGVEYNEYLDSIQQEYEMGNKKFKEQTAIISRTNAPLVQTALKMLQNNVDFQILGRDLSKELISHIRRVTWAKPHEHQIQYLGETLSDYLANLEEEWEGKVSKKDELKDIQQTTEALLSVLLYLEGMKFQKSPKSQPMRTGDDFVKYIQEKLGGLEPENSQDYAKLKAKDPHTFVTLTTAHKSKGMEYDRVIINDPGAFDPDRDQIKTPAEAQQEKNAWYVALTRARRHLVIAEPGEDD